MLLEGLNNPAGLSYLLEKNHVADNWKAVLGNLDEVIAF
jgi:hypothetical protein